MVVIQQRGETTDGLDSFECLNTDLTICLRQREGDVGQSGLHRGDVLDDHVDVDLGVGACLEDLGGLAGMVWHTHNRDLGLAAVVCDTGNDRGFHIVSFFINRLSDNQGPLAVGERGPHTDRHVEPPGVLDAPQMQDLCPGGSHLEHLFVGDPLDPLCGRDDPRICGEDAVDVGIDLADIRPQCGSQRDRRGVRATTAQCRNVLAVRADTLEPCHDGDVTVVQRAPDPPRRNVDDARLAVCGVGDDPCLGPRERACGVAEVGYGHGQQSHGDALAGRQQHVHLAAGRQRSHLLSQVDQFVGCVAHGGDHDTDLVSGLARLNDPPCYTLDAVGVCQ